MSSFLRSSETLYTQGPLFRALGLLFCALVQEEAIFTVCKRCANRILHACIKKTYIRCKTYFLPFFKCNLFNIIKLQNNINLRNIVHYFLLSDNIEKLMR